MAEKIIVPRYYQPRPYQKQAWRRRMSNRYNFYFKLWPRQCFSADTLVSTPNGLVRIDSIRIGDSVFSYSDNGDIVVSKVPVRTVIETAKKVLYTGHLGDGKIFVYDVENIVKIRTGEEGYDALQDVE